MFMLVLSRRPGEEIVIDGHIRLTILSVDRDQIRIGIAAPPAVTVDRQEVHARRAWTAGPAIRMGDAG
jgi:carbon storage regulator